MEQDSYMVQRRAKDESWKRDGCLGMVIMIAVLSVIPLINGTGSAVSNGLNAGILIISIVLLRMMYAPEKPGQRIRVSADHFTVIEEGKEERTYRFSEVTRVSMHRTRRIGKRTCRSGPDCWRIDVGDQCAAVFSNEMENYIRLLAKLDELGLITPYGTGYKQ